MDQRVYGHSNRRMLSKLMRNLKLSPLEINIYLVAETYNPCYPGYKKLGKDLDISIQHISRAMRNLIKKNFMFILEKGKNRGSNTTFGFHSIEDIIKLNNMQDVITHDYLPDHASNSAQEEIVTHDYLPSSVSVQLPSLVSVELPSLVRASSLYKETIIKKKYKESAPSCAIASEGRCSVSLKNIGKEGEVLPPIIRPEEPEDKKLTAEEISDRLKNFSFSSFRPSKHPTGTNIPSEGKKRLNQGLSAKNTAFGVDMELVESLKHSPSYNPIPIDYRPNAKDIAMDKEFNEILTKGRIFSAGLELSVDNILAVFNNVSNNNYSSSSRKTAQLVNARIKEGRTWQDFEYVIRKQNFLWRDNPSMANNINPGTIFKEDKFEKYLNETFILPVKGKEKFSIAAKHNTQGNPRLNHINFAMHNT